MSKRIGIASEEPTDYLVLKTIIDRITGEDNQCDEENKMKKPSIKYIIIILLIVFVLFGIYCFAHFAYVASTT